MPLDPKQKYLIQDGSNHIFIWTEALSKRKDMKPYHLDEGRVMPKPIDDSRTIKLGEKQFQVVPDLEATIDNMSKKIDALQAENDKLKKAAEEFDAFRERMLTDNADLQEQLEKAKAGDAPEASEEEAKERKKPGPKPKPKDE